MQAVESGYEAGAARRSGLGRQGYSCEVDLRLRPWRWLVTRKKYCGEVQWWVRRQRYSNVEVGSWTIGE